jgi:hypothetical protein
VPDYDEILSLLAEAAVLEEFADAFARAGVTTAGEGKPGSARNLKRVAREHRIKAMLARGRAAGLLGHELPEPDA